MINNSRPTAFCHRCRRNVEVTRITAEHLKCYYLRKAEEYNRSHGTQQAVEVPMNADARQVEARGACGHLLNIVTTLTNIAAINERNGYERDMAKEARENALSEAMAT